MQSVSLERWWSMVTQNKTKLIIALFFLAIAIMIYSLSGDYVSEQPNTTVSPDLILDHIGPYNLDFVFVWLFILVMAVYMAYPIFIKPYKLPYFLNMFSLLIIVRSAFIIFTHLRPPPDAVAVMFPWILKTISFSNDLFFSGHVGVPFLGFLMFRKENKKISYFMLASSIILGATALVMHVHYSIDVFSAYFITYGVYRIGNRFIRN